MEKYGQDNYFIIDENEKGIIKAKNPVSLLGFKSTITDYFGDKIEVEVVFRQPSVKEIKEFADEQVKIQNAQIPSSSLSFFNKWFNRMLVYPEPRTEEGIALSNLFDYYPTTAVDLMLSLFSPALSSQVEDDEQAEAKSKIRLLKPFKV